MTAELDGARRNAQWVAKVTQPKSAEWMLAQAVLLLVQHCEKWGPPPAGSVP